MREILGKKIYLQIILNQLLAKRSKAYIRELKKSIMGKMSLYIRELLENYLNFEIILVQIFRQFLDRIDAGFI